MRSIVDKLNSAKYDYDRLKKIQADVIGKIKEELTEKYCYIDNKDKFRHSICLFFGEFVEKYSMQNLPKNLKLERAKTWDSNFKYQESLNYYTIYQEWGDIFNKNSDYVGFICERKYLHEAISDDTIKKMWKYQILQKGYNESLNTFTEEILHSNLDLYDMYVDYLNNNKNKFTIDIIHKPSLNIKNIVLYLKIDN